MFRSSTISTQPSVSTSNGVPMLGAEQGQAAADQRRLGDPLADREHVGVLGVLEHAAERLGLEGAVEPLLGLLREVVLAARVKRRKFGP